ncbi:MAG: 6-carboxytetrahydropterin synthase [bacterium]
MIEITRREEFCAAHRLYNSELSIEQNDALYGKCSNPHYHGHNYVLEVTLRGPVNPETGMTYNLADMKNTLRSEVIDKLDHKNLNEDAAEFLKNRIPTAENIVISIWERLEEHFESGLLYRVRLFENDRNFVDYFGGR